AVDGADRAGALGRPPFRRAAARSPRASLRLRPSVRRRVAAAADAAAVAVLVRADAAVAGPVAAPRTGCRPVRRPADARLLRGGHRPHRAPGAEPVGAAPGPPLPAATRQPPVHRRAGRPGEQLLRGDPALTTTPGGRSAG